MGETVVVTGGYKVGVFRAPRPMTWNGMEMQEGEFAMYSKTHGEWIHTDNPITLATRIELDRLTQFESRKDTRLIGGNPFNGRADIDDSILRDGDDIVDTSIYNVVDNMTKHPGMPRLRVTSALRHSDDKETLANPQSLHTVGGAIDLRVIDPSTGGLDAKVIDGMIAF